MQKNIEVFCTTLNTYQKVWFVECENEGKKEGTKQQEGAPHQRFRSR